MNGTNNDRSDPTPVIRAPEDSDVEMETQEEVHNSCNGKNGSSNGYQNGNSHTICEDGYEDEDDDMGETNEKWEFCCDCVCCCSLDVDVPVCRKSCGKPAVERILEFGRELHSMNQRLKLEQNFSENNEKMLTVSVESKSVLC